MDITSAILDPELDCTAFTVERNTYTRSREGTVSSGSTARAAGCIHPGTPEMIRLLPEEERNETYIVIYTDYPLSTGTPEAAGANASSIVAAPHSGDGSFQMTSPPTEFPPQAALIGSPSFTGPDRIHWNDQIWRVVRVRDWQGFGYCQAYAVLMREGR